MSLIIAVVPAGLAGSFLCSLCEAALYGVATLEDVLEYLSGKPIVGEHDSHPDMQHLARERASFRKLSEDT